LLVTSLRALATFSPLSRPPHDKETTMKNAARFVAGALMILASATLTTAQQPPAGDEQTLRKEVNAFMDQYWELWSAGRIDQLVERIYHPFGQLSNQGHSSIDQLEARFPDTRKSLVSKGYGKSQMPMPGRNVCILSPTVAVVSGRGMRYLTDGKVMGEFGWTYTLLKGPTGWRMVSIYSHDPKKALTCTS
jgi:hypothetical protein